MEEVLINIDSRYRDIISYPNESKFRVNLEKCYKNIVSIKMISVEMSNSINYIDSKKNNNWFTVHLPNKKNDPEGTKIELEEGLLQSVSSIQTVVNSVLRDTFNTNLSLQELRRNNKDFAEKYFYFLYLTESITLNFDFNGPLVLPISLRDQLILEKGWYSVYGIITQIKNYIINKYGERVSYLQNNPSASPVALDSGNFTLDTFSMKIFDRRFRSIDTDLMTPGPTIYDCIRIDMFTPSGSYLGSNIHTSLALLKNDFYRFFIYDTTTFIVQNNPTVIPVLNMGILDKLNTNNYLIPVGYNYTNEGGYLESASVYPFNNIPDTPSLLSTQTYNLSLAIDSSCNKVFFVNAFAPTCSNNTSMYYYWSDPLKVTASNWKSEVSGQVTNTLLNLLDKLYLRNNYFIIQSQYNNPNFKPTVERDIPSFEIDFNTYTNLTNNIVGSTMDIKKIQYPPVGFYLGFRPRQSASIDFTYSSVWQGSAAVIKGIKPYNTFCEDYIFMKLNDWGYIDFFNQTVFAKILLNPDLDDPVLDDYVNKEYRFRQPVNVQKLDIELIDFLGNTVDMNGFDYSFTLELRQIVSSDHKISFEKQNLVFSNSIY